MSPTATTAPAAKTRMTVDEYWEFVNRPENDNKVLELRRGEVIELSRPTRRHGIVTSLIGFQLELYVRRVGRGYVATNESGVILTHDPATVVGPDVAYFTDASTFDDVHPKWGEDVPVLAAEVLSPNDKPSEVNAKVEDYLKSGVKVVWVVDYENRKVTVYRPDRTLTVVPASGDLTGGDDLPGFSCPVAELFRLPGDRQLPADVPTQPPAA